MPLYDFTCESCGKVEERIVKLAEVEEQYCDCQEISKMKRNSLNPIHFELKGKWFKNGGEY